MAENIVLAIMCTISTGVLICAGWAMYECFRREREIMEEAMKDPVQRNAINALWYAPKARRATLDGYDG